MDDENPYAPPASSFAADDQGMEILDEPHREGSLLVIPKGAELPDRCLKCNAPAEGYRFSRTLSWHRPAWFLLVLLSLWLYVIVYFFVRWKAKVTVGLCPRHRRRRSRAIASGWLITLGGIGSIFAGALVSNNAAPFLIGGGTIAILVGLIGSVLRSRVFVVKRIDEHYVWLSHTAPDYLASFSK